MTSSILALSFLMSSTADFSFSQTAFFSLKSSRRPASSSESFSHLSFESLSVSFLRAASSISSYIILRRRLSSSSGMESISVLIEAQASSTRSMALSGRNLSVM